jgi:cell cycle arrest protein BUB3
MFPDSSTLVSSSWDQTLKIWDLSAPPDRPCQSIAFREKLILSEISTEFRVIAHGSKNSVFIVDIRSPENIERRVSSLGSQLRSSAASRPLDFGWAIGSIDGRVAIEYFGDLRCQAQRFSFSCNRHEEGESVIVYPVNSLCFHPGTGVLTSGSAKGNICFWDIDAKRKLTEIQSPFDLSVASLDYDSDGEALAIAFSYTWDKGEIDHPADRLLLHFPAEQSVTPSSAGQDRDLGHRCVETVATGTSRLCPQPKQ